MKGDQIMKNGALKKIEAAAICLIGIVVIGYTTGASCQNTAATDIFDVTKGGIDCPNNPEDYNCGYYQASANVYCMVLNGYDCITGPQELVSYCYFTGPCQGYGKCNITTQGPWSNPVMTATTADQGC